MINARFNDAIALFSPIFYCTFVKYRLCEILGVYYILKNSDKEGV
jgi:hypothetical protein